MRSRIRLNLALAGLVVALALAAWLGAKPAAQAEFRLSTLSAASITRITIEKAGQPAIVLQKNMSGWHLSTPFTARADGETVGQILETLGATSRQRFPVADLGRFQLDKPLLRLSLNDQEFSFGTQNPLSGEVYVATNDGVYLVAPYYLAHALKTPADFVSRAFLAEDEIPIGFEFPDFKLSQLDNGRWSAAPDNPDWSQDELNRWTDEWRHAASLVTQPYDGTSARDAFTLRLRNGRSVSCKILRHEPELVLLRGDEKLQYHFPAEIAKRLLHPGK